LGRLYNPLNIFFTKDVLLLHNPSSVAIIFFARVCLLVEFRGFSVHLLKETEVV
jgi:hypothetical protein